LRHAGYAQSIAIATGTIVPVCATIVTVLAVVYSGHDLLASDVSFSGFRPLIDSFRLSPLLLSSSSCCLESV
jgi:hypothetical protein